MPIISLREEDLKASPRCQSDALFPANLEVLSCLTILSIDFSEDPFLFFFFFWTKCTQRFRMYFKDCVCVECYSRARCALEPWWQGTASLSVSDTLTELTSSLSPWRDFSRTRAPTPPLTRISSPMWYFRMLASSLALPAGLWERKQS